MGWPKFSEGRLGALGESQPHAENFGQPQNFGGAPMGPWGVIAIHSPKFVLLCSLCSSSTEEAGKSHTGVEGVEGRDGRLRRRWSWSRSPRMG